MTLKGVTVEEDVFWNFAPARLPYVALSRVSDGADVTLGGFPASQAMVKPDENYPPIMARLLSWAAS